jgi:hypothetical protein
VTPRRITATVLIGSGLIGLGAPAGAQDMPGMTGLEPRQAAPAAQCAAGQHWDSGMAMCMTGDAAAVMFHLNQFMVYSSTSGPRGQARVTGPGSWMLMYDQPLSPGNRLHVDLMGSAEQLTVGDEGTPQLLQTEHVDSMHAHDTVMALAVSDVLAFGRDHRQQLTLLFAPRGEAAIGPVPFMHRPSAEGNPDAPLGHGLQDGFHDASTVLGVAYRGAGATLEATAFSGRSISRPFPIHRPDSYGLRMNWRLGRQAGVGASYADVRSTGDLGGTEHDHFTSAWLTTASAIHGGALKSSLIWGRARRGHDSALDSFLEEAVYQLGKNKLLGRVERLQIQPRQLDLTAGGDLARGRWVSALTLGYERTLAESRTFDLFGGATYTLDSTPSAFRAAYGSDPQGFKIYLRLKIDISSRPSGSS